ncbi:MAG: hypothetical protein Q9199_005551, partial [Rusavskia elegans]
VSIQEARTAIDTLIPAVEGIRTSSQDVSRRLATLELHSAQRVSGNESVHQVRPLLPSMDQPGSKTSQGNTQPTEIATKAGSSHSEADADRGPALLATQDPAVVPNFDGVDESGMSTLVKQMQIAYAPETITAREQEYVRAGLFVNLVAAIHGTLEIIIELGWQYESDVLFKTQMQESLQLFKTLLSLELLKATAIVLILNKLDIFKKQIQKHPLRTWYPDFVGREKDYEAALSYIVAKFKATKRLSDEREIHVYYTDATSIEACQATLRDIEDNVMPRRPETHNGREFADMNVTDIIKGDQKIRAIEIARSCFKAGYTSI